MDGAVAAANRPVVGVGAAAAFVETGAAAVAAVVVGTADAVGTADVVGVSSVHDTAVLLFGSDIAID